MITSAFVYSLALSLFALASVAQAGLNRDAVPGANGSATVFGSDDSYRPDIARSCGRFEVDRDDSPCAGGDNLRFKIPWRVAAHGSAK